LKFHKDVFFQNLKKRKTAFTAVIVAGLLFYPIGLIHEFGHILVCVSNGFNYTLSLQGFNLQTQCSGISQPIELYFSLGGIFGMIGASLLLISKRIRSNRGILIGVSTVIFDNFLKSIFETYAHFAYISNPIFGMLMGLLVGVFMIGLLIFFDPTFSKRRTQNKT
jgi:hypothetical protein